MNISRSLRNMNLKGHDFSKLIFGLPFFLIFIVNLYITRQQGFIYAGELAVFAGVSTFISIMLSMRWDIEILVKESQNLRESLSNGIITILIISIILLSISYLYFSYNQTLGFNIYLIYSAILIAFYELHMNIFLKKNEIVTFVILRLIPPILLVIFSIQDFLPSQSWFFSYFFSLIIFLFCVFCLHRDVWNLRVSLASFFHKFVLMLAPTFSALIANSISVVWLISISYLFGSYEAGIWINAYRITSLPVVFCGAVVLPLVLVAVGNKNLNYDKYIIMFKFSFLLILLTLITILIFFVQGEQIFYHLTNQKSSLSSLLLLSILFISFMQYSIQYWKELFQSVNKTIIMLLILSIELFLSILIYSYFDGVNIETFVNWILVITSFCFSLILLLIVTSFLKFKN